MKYILFYSIMFMGLMAYAETATVLIPQTWEPDIDVQTISDWSEEALKDSSGDIPQQGLNRYLAMLASLWDSRLMLSYIQLSAQMSPVEKEIFAKEQEAWLVRRETASSEAEKGEAGGTGAPATYSQVYIELTQKRYKAIRERLSSK